MAFLAFSATGVAGRERVALRRKAMKKALFAPFVLILFGFGAHLCIIVHANEHMLPARRLRTHDRLSCRRGQAPRLSPRWPSSDAALHFLTNSTQ